MFKVRSRKPVAGKTLNAEICKAIKGTFLVVVTYFDHTARTIEPHCHGHSRVGEEVLSAFQRSGPSEAGWKMFDVTKFTSWQIQVETFTPQPDFNPDHPGMTQIHCCLRADEDRLV